MDELEEKEALAETESSRSLLFKDCGIEELRTKMQEKEAELAAIQSNNNRLKEDYKNKSNKIDELEKMKFALAHMMQAVSEFASKVKNNVFFKKYFPDSKALPTSNEDQTKKVPELDGDDKGDER